MKNKYILTTITLIVIPTIAFGALTGLRTLINEVYSILQMLDNLIFALALVYFFWGVAQFILKANDEKAREEGRKKIMWGIVALFVLASWWGIITVFGGLVGVPSGSSNSSIRGGGFDAGLGGGGNNSGGSYGSGFSGGSNLPYDDGDCNNGGDSLCPTTGYEGEGY